MGSQFHTPSLGDGLDLSVVEDAEPSILDSGTGTTGGYPQHQTQLDHFESKRMQSMEQNPALTDSSMTDITNSPVGLTNSGNSLSNTVTSGIFNITAHFNNNLNSNHATSTPMQHHAPPTTMAARKQLSPSANDSNEPPKPLSPYTLFFRETVSAIKQQNPNCAFTDLTRIVSSMWEALDPMQKENYNKKTEAAKNEYFEQLKVFKQLQSPTDNSDTQTFNNDAIMNAYNVNNANNYPNDNFAPIKQDPNPGNISTPENQTTLTTSPSLTSSAIRTTIPVATVLPTPQNTLSETSSNPITSNYLQETTSQQTPLPKETVTNTLCIRDGCNKYAILNPDWEDEYCSNECVIVHCRNVFNDWVLQNKETTSIQQ